ncbi:MAG: sugar-binding protein [Kiritimatiellia bacterium]|jgi:hypothetical protein
MKSTQLFALGCLAAASALPASAQRTINRGLHAPPAKDPVVIDGRLDDWDLSGAIVCCKDVSTLLDAESCQVAAMWDAEALYLAFHFKDDTPMRNKIDPVTMPGNGWRSDSVQLRFNLDGFVSHVDAWYYSDGEKPAMTISYGRLGRNAPKQPEVNRSKYPMEMGAELAFQMDDDGLGYVQEMKIPWAVLTLDGNMPPGDADLRLGLELFWGDVTASAWPRSRVTDNLSPEATTVGFFWTSEQNWGKLILEDKNDLDLPPPPWLQAAARTEPQGLVPIAFSLPSESYVTLAIEDAQGNRVKSLVGGVKFPAGDHTVMWSGLDDRDELLPVGDYAWVGIARDELDIKWRMSFYQPNSRKPWNTADGTGAWGPDHGVVVAAAAGDGLVFLAGLCAEAGNGLFAVDLAGEKRWSAKEAGADLLACSDGVLYAYRSTDTYNPLGFAATGIMCFDAATGRWRDIVDANGRCVKRRPLAEEGEVVVGFAANAKGLFLSVADADGIRMFDKERFALLRTIAIAGPGALCALDDDALLVATASGLLQLSIADGDIQTLVEGDFSEAAGIAAGAGRIAVSFGEPLHQIQVFALDGAPLNPIGKNGGRTQNGFYDPTEGFYNPAGLAVDSAGRLWVTENGKQPKRTSVWKNGAWLRDFIGDTGYGGGGLINPLDPSMAFYDGMRFEIDIDKGTWKLVEVGLALPEGAGQHGISPTNTDAGKVDYLNAYGGRAYLHNSRNTHEIYRQRDDGRWALCVFIDPRRKFAWIDKNDNGVIDDDETTLGTDDDVWGATAHRWGSRPSQNLDLYFSQGLEKPGLKLRLQGVSKGGTPLYDFAAFEEMAGEVCNGIGLRDGSYNSGSHGDRGEYFSEMRKIYPKGETRRTFWFRGLETRRWAHRLPAPGIVLFPFQAHGVADAPKSLGGELVLWASDFGQRYLFTDDMLYVSQLFADSRSRCEDWPENPTPGFSAANMSPFQESFSGFFTRTLDGRYLLTSGFVDCRVFEIEGLESLRRLSGGAITLDEAAQRRATEIKAFRSGESSTEKRLTIPKAADAPGENAATAKIKVDAQRGADVSVAYSDEALHVTWDVRDESPMRNGADLWQLAFKGGDAVDLMFRAPGGDLRGKTPRKGDFRLLLAEIKGEMQAVLYRPVSDAKAPCRFDAYEGANRGNAVAMDEVRLAPEVKATLQRGERGCVVKAAIPWTLVGDRPAPGTPFGIDFGVLFSDEAGRSTILRAYWQNRNTQIVTDIPSEAALQPENWGEATLQ